MGKESFVRSTVENLAQSYIDALFEEDAKSKQSSGISSVITRRQLWHCCEWCASLAGSYEYAPGKYPKDIFRRHQNCRCMVTVKTERSGYTDVWSKKEYESQREARIAREQEILQEDSTLAEYQQKLRTARDSGKKYADTTEYWKDANRGNGTNRHAEVQDPNKVFYKDGKRYEIDGHFIKFEPSKQERDIADVLAEQLHEKVILQPKIEDPPGIRMPDYIIAGEGYDLKTITGCGKNTLDNAVKEKKGQSKIFVFDVSNSNLSNDELNRQAVFIIGRREWIDKVILIKDNEIIKILERV